MLQALAPRTLLTFGRSDAASSRTQSPSRDAARGRAPMGRGPAGGSGRRLTILQPARYPSIFNGPRHGRHRILRTPFLPLHKVSAAWQGLLLYPPQLRAYDLIHSVNRIPLARKPFVITFESHLPRVFGAEGSLADRLQRRRLLSEDCRAIIAMSDWAKGMFMAQHAGDPDLPALLRKLRVIHPNVEVADDVRLEPACHDRPLRIVFVGNHFARKGGVVAVRLARLALERGIPLEVDIVSKLDVGGGIWTDPEDASLFAPDLDLLGLPNVRLHSRLPNAEVVTLLRDADFSLLTTLSDTFGFSVLESFSVATPAVVTSLNALPEMVSDRVNGLVVPMEADRNNEWRHLGRRHEPGYWRLVDDAYDRMAERTLDGLLPYIRDRARLGPLRAAAHRTALERFDARAADRRFDALYDQAADG